MASKIDAQRTPARIGATYDLFGSTLTNRVTAADTNGAYALVEYDSPPGLPGSPVHRHQHTEEYILVLEGNLSVVVEGDERTIGPGEGILFSPGVEHSFANRGDERVRFLTLLRPGGLEALFAEVAARLTGDREPTADEFAKVIAPYDIAITDHAH